MTGACRWLAPHAAFLRLWLEPLSGYWKTHLVYFILYIIWMTGYSFNRPIWLANTTWTYFVPSLSGTAPGPWKKMDASIVIVFLGIKIDSVVFLASLPKVKLDLYAQELATIISSQRCPLGMLHSLAGKLNWSLSVVLPLQISRPSFPFRQIWSQTYCDGNVFSWL